MVSRRLNRRDAFYRREVERCGLGEQASKRTPSPPRKRLPASISPGLVMRCRRVEVEFESGGWSFPCEIWFGVLSKFSLVLSLVRDVDQGSESEAVENEIVQKE